MAWTARDDDEKKEFMDPPEELQKKVDRLAEWFRESKHTIAFTVSGWSLPEAQAKEKCACVIIQVIIMAPLSFLSGSWCQHVCWK